jgi:hypothetical protein
MHDVELCGIFGTWNGTDKVIGRFCRNILNIPFYAANGTAQMEMGRLYAS